MTRSQAILAAVSREIALRRSLIDDAPDVVEVAISVKLVAGTDHVRGVSYHEEHIPGEGKRIERKRLNG